MRVALIASRFPVLSETFVVAQVTGLLDRGHDVTILAGRPAAGQPEHEAVARYRLDRLIRYWPDQLDPAFVSRVAQVTARQPLRVARAMWACAGRPGGNRLAVRAMVTAAEEPFDVILCHFGNVAVEAQRLRDVGALSGKLVAVFHAYELTRLLRREGDDYYAALFARADLIMPVSQHWARRLEVLGCPVSKIAVHHMGVDCERLPFSARKPPGPGAPMEVISVSRLVEKKGLAHAVEAVATLAGEGIPIRYRIIGDGPLRPALSAQLARLGAGERIQLLGARRPHEVAALLDESHVLLAPSVTAQDGDQEGIPVSIMEAMALGLVVVGTHHTGIPELVRDGVSGYLVPEGDVAALATRLRELAAAPERWAGLGRAGRDIVERDFNQDRLNDALEARLQALSAERHCARTRADAATDPTFAVIIVAFGRPRQLERALEALLTQTVGRSAMEICVVDNGGAGAVKGHWQPRVDVWCDPGENLGCSGGRNLGAERTTAPVLVFIDDDGIPNARFLESLGAVLERHPDVVAVRGRAVAHEHPILTSMAAHYDRGPQEQEDLLTLEGAAAIRRSAWDVAGGFDATRAFHEGLELSLRLLRTAPDARMMYTPDAVLKHDFFQGPGHLVRKARMMAAAANQVRREEDADLLEIIEQAKAYKTSDGRALWAQVVGRLLAFAYKGTINAFRLADLVRSIDSPV